MRGDARGIPLDRGQALLLAESLVKFAPREMQVAADVINAVPAIFYGPHQSLHNFVEGADVADVLSCSRQGSSIQGAQAVDDHAAGAYNLAKPQDADFTGSFYQQLFGFIQDAFPVCQRLAWGRFIHDSPPCSP